MCRSTKPLPRSVMTWLSQILSNRVLAIGFLRGGYQHPPPPEGRRFAQGRPLLPWYQSAENISLLRAFQLHDPGRSGVSVERHWRCGRTVMRPVMAIPGSVSKSRWIAAAALVVLALAAGAGWLLFGTSATPPQAA